MSARFRPGWPLTVLVLVLLPLAARLAFWQLDRADAKRALESGYLASLGGLPIDERELLGLAENAAFKRTRLDGQFDDIRQFFVDNRTHHGAPGYWVVTPFSTTTTTYLVNRGWIAASGRDVLPDAPPPSDTRRIEVVPWPATGLGPLAGRDDWSEAWPKRVQRVDIERMAQVLTNPSARSIDVLRMEMRLEPGSPGVLEPVAAALDLSPARHVGYAVQWAALGVALVMAWVGLGLRRGRRLAV